MSLVLAIQSERNIYEYFLPGINNRKINVDLPASETGYSFDISLSLEVWNGIWQINHTDDLTISKDRELKDTVLLEKGLTLTCEHKRSRERISIVIADNYEGYSGFDKFLLTQGRYSIGRDEGNTIQYNTHNHVSGKHAMLEVDSCGVCTLTDNRSSNLTFVNGKRVDGSRVLIFGDVIYIIGLKIVYLGDLIAVNHPPEPIKFNGFTPYIPQPQSGVSPDNNLKSVDEYYQRSPRQVEALDNEAIEIEAPPNPTIGRRQPLIFTIGPAITMVLPMAAGVMFTTWSAQRSETGIASPFIFMGIITSVTAAVIGIFWALANYKYNKKTEREDEEKRSTLYRVYLEKIRKLLTQKHITNKELLDKKYPNVSECLCFVKSKSRRLWERNVNHFDFLTVRIGQGEIPSPNEIVIPKERFSLVDDSLAEEPQNIKTEYCNLKNVPVCISLSDNTLIGIIGDTQEICNKIAQLLAVQIAAYHSYNDVRMAFIFSEKDAHDYDFAKWFPHTWNTDENLRMMACSAHGVGELLYDLSLVLRERMEEREYSTDKIRPLPHYVIFISAPSLVEDEAVMKYLSAPTAQMGVTTVMLYGQIDRLPNNCTVIVQNDEEYKGYYSLDNSFVGFKNVIFDTIDNELIETFSRDLSNIRVRETHITGAVPQLLTFLDMYKTSTVDNIDVERLWLKNRTYESMKAMIGYRGPETPLYLDIHEKYHGPHGLMAGTTGSGKSETLQTYILSLAMSYHPYEISFILIDYKGGGMASSFENLPHIAGIITNLGGNQTNRALASINSEIKRRQAIFNENRIKHIDNYIELFRANKVNMPVPHLLIIADEFAELKKEQPEFVRELVSASRVGRSLGIHLILATQKPSGVVDDEIWSNSKFKLCLRVQDKQDSNEMIKRPDAAYITNAGRGYFQVGNDEIFDVFQSGWSGAVYEPEIAYADSKRGDAKIINLWGKPMLVGGVKKVTPKVEEKKLTQLEAVVLHIIRTAETIGVKAIDNIWLPPLPKKISLKDISLFTQTAYRNGVWSGANGELNPVIGIIDDPVNQRQTPVSIDMMTEGHLLVTGSSAGGKTTFMQTLLYSLTAAYSPKQLNIYIADFGSRTMGVFGLLPHVGGVVYDNETDKADKLIAMLLNELNRRKVVFSEKGIGSIREYVRLYEDVPFIVFAIENSAAWNENCSKQEDNLIRLSHEAASYGIYLVITCSNSGDIRNKIRQNINCGVGLQLADRFEYEEAIGARTNIVAEDRTPGRGLICSPQPLEFQTALCLNENDAVSLNLKLKEQFEDMASAWTGAKAPAIPQVPTDMSLESLMLMSEFMDIVSSTRYIPLGYDLTKAKIESIDLSKVFCYSISGASRSGKTNMPKVFMWLVKAQGGRIFLFDGGAHELETFSNEIGAERYVDSIDSLFALMEEIIVPEYTRRNKKKAEFIKNGKRNINEYIASDQKIFIFINDMTAFCEAVYESKRDMKGFMEQVITRGDNHMIYMFACVSQNDMVGEYNAKRFMRGFVGWKEGLHFGGKIEDQRVFDFEVPVLERGKKLPAGYGHSVIDGVTKRIVTPIVE